MFSNLRSLTKKKREKEFSFKKKFNVFITFDKRVMTRFQIFKKQKMFGDIKLQDYCFILLKLAFKVLY